MKGAVLYAPRDVRVETLDDPRIKQPTDPNVRLSVTCICRSQHWP
jgi:threonine dehydrogenase-like Zn-dependent dehydrogenase